MSLASVVRRAGPYTGNDATTQFGFTFKVFTEADVTVVRRNADGSESVLVKDSDYEVDLNEDQDSQPGGVVTYPLAIPDPSTGLLPPNLSDEERLTVVGNLDYSQPTQLPAGGAFRPTIVENAMDRITALVQQLDERIRRTLKFPISDSTPEDDDLPTVVERASKYLAFDAAGNLIATGGTDTGSPTTEYAASLLDDTNATEARATLQAAKSGANSDITSMSGLVGPGLLPVGAVIYTAGSAAPTGYLKANGAAVSRATYAALFAVIGTTYGAGDGASTFNLPDLRGEFVRGWDDARGVDAGRAAGSAQADALQNITGTFSARPFVNNSTTPAIVNGTGALSVSAATGTGGASPLASGDGAYNLDVVSFSAAGSPGARTAAETRPRNVALLACIKF